MKRLIALIVVLVAGLFAVQPADASCFECGCHLVAKKCRTYTVCSETVKHSRTGKVGISADGLGYSYTVETSVTYCWLDGVEGECRADPWDDCNFCGPEFEYQCTVGFFIDKAL